MATANGRSAMMTTVKYFYVDDDTAILFGANGTGLTATLVATSGALSSTTISMPTFPMWCYLSGLVFAFASKSVIMLYNNDVKQRERSQSARDFLIEARAKHAGDEETLSILEFNWREMEKQRSSLLTVKMTNRLNLVRAYSFVFSALLFLFGTISIIVYVGA